MSDKRPHPPKTMGTFIKERMKQQKKFLRKAITIIDDPRVLSAIEKSVLTNVNLDSFFVALAGADPADEKTLEFLDEAFDALVIRPLGKQGPLKARIGIGISNLAIISSAIPDYRVAEILEYGRMLRRYRDKLSGEGFPAGEGRTMTHRAVCAELAMLSRTTITSAARLPKDNSEEISGTKRKSRKPRVSRKKNPSIAPTEVVVEGVNGEPGIGDLGE